MRENSVDVVSEIDASPVGALQILVVFLCGLTYALDGFDTLSISFVAPTLAEQWSHPTADFGPIFAAGLFGLLVGALTIGPLADRFGRKSLIIVSTVIFGLFSLAAAFTTSLTELGIVRFLTGIGLGGAMPNLIALTVEYMPRRARAFLVTTMSCGFAAGGMIGGAVSSVIIPLWGWQSVFMVGGVLPLLLIPVLMIMLPESLPFLARKGGRATLIGQLLRRITGRTYEAAQSFAAPGQQEGSRGVVRLLQDGRAALTVMLWLMFFMNFLVTFMMFNWAPVLVRDSGASLSLALTASILMNLGTLCGVGPAYIADRIGASRTVAVNFLLAAIFLLLLAGVQGNIWFTLTLCFLVGVTNMGSTFIANVIAATIYPIEIRSTGLGWALGIGRLGSIMGPLIGGYLLGAGWTATALFLVAAIAAVCAALAGLGMAIAQKRRTSSDVVRPITVT